MLAVAAVSLRPQDVAPAARATAGPFTTLAAIVAVAALAGRAGAFRVLARRLIPERAPDWGAASAVLAFTALLSALANLDVAVVVAMPVALAVAARQHLDRPRVAVAVAVTANTASFLLPTSNITTMLLLGRVRLGPVTYLRDIWLAWLLVTVVTVGALAIWLARSADGGAEDSAPPPAARPPARAVTDLVPMFVAASALRAILASGVALPGGVVAQLVRGSLLASIVNNLPAAAALRPAGAAGLFAAVLAAAIGPDLLVTGSIATVICRRIARAARAPMSGWRFTAVGVALMPAQFTAALIGLHLTGALR